MLKYFLPHGLVLFYQKSRKKKKQEARYTPGSTTIDGQHIYYPDAPSFWFTYQEIFEKEIYAFRPDTDSLCIIDAGANIGLASLYWKKAFPHAKIIAIEADTGIAKFFKQNTQAYFADGIALIEKALWKDDLGVHFHSEGADAGLVKSTGQNKIPTCRLSEIIKPLSKVDFLKIDIEGAELVVLKEAEASLSKVKRLFVEYHSFLNQEQCLPELLDILKRQGFRYHISSPGLSSKKPFLELNTYLNMDMQLNIYAWKN